MPRYRQPTHPSFGRRVAAESALELLGGGTLDGYEPALGRELDRSFAASWKAKYALERFPHLIFGVARLPLVWGFISAFLRGASLP